jgi:hypothetical protein
MRLTTGLAFFAGLAIATGLAALDRKNHVQAFAGYQAERIAGEGKTDVSTRAKSEKR